MTAALIYLQAVSGWNRVLARVRRLRQPKYLVGAIIGGLYFGLVFLKPFFTYGRYGSKAPLPLMTGPVWEFVASAVLCLLTILIWLVPHGRAALVFSETEIAFLFPAPVRRSTLIHYKLIKSQVSILFTVLFLTVLSSRTGGWGGALMRATGWWILLSTMNLHIIGSSFACTLLLDRGVTIGKWRLGVLVLMVAFLGLSAWWIRHTVSLPQRADFANQTTLLHYMRALVDAAPAQVLLAPFRAAARPFLAQNARDFLAGLGPALGLLALHYLWVVRSDVAFEEASLEASRRQAERVAAVRQGRWRAQPQRRLRAPFRLSPKGSPAIALLWKNLLGAGQLFSLRVWLPMLLWAFFVGWTFNHHSNQTVWPQVIGTMAGVLFLFSVLVGPQIVRQDFRQDLPAADLLKTYPMRGWQMALGQLLAPTAILTGAQWVLLLLCVTLLDDRLPQGFALYFSWRWAAALGLAILVPALNCVLLIIPNAATLMFPAWFGGPQLENRGIEVLGQRLVLLLAQLFMFALAVIPAAIVFGVVYLLAASPLFGDVAAIPVSAFAAALALAAEAAFGLIGLGRLFENFDLSADR